MSRWTCGSLMNPRLSLSCLCVSRVLSWLSGDLSSMRRIAMAGDSAAALGAQKGGAKVLNGCLSGSENPPSAIAPNKLGSVTMCALRVSKSLACVTLLPCFLIGHRQNESCLEQVIVSCNRRHCRRSGFGSGLKQGSRGQSSPKPF